MYLAAKNWRSTQQLIIWTSHWPLKTIRQKEDYFFPRKLQMALYKYIQSFFKYHSFFLKVLLFNVLKNPYFWHPRYISSSFPWENSKNHCYYMYQKESAMLTRFKCIITDQKELIFRSSMTTWKQKFLQCFIAGNRCSSLKLSLRDWRPRNVLIQM